MVELYGDIDWRQEMGLVVKCPECGETIAGDEVHIHYQDGGTGE